MSFEKYTVDKLHQSEQREIRDGEATLASELARVFDEHTLREGVEVDFGSNAAVFRQAIDILGINEAVKGERPQLFVNSVASQGDISTRFVNSLQQWVANSGDIANCLDLLQSEQWRTRSKTPDDDRELDYDGRISSHVVLSSNPRAFDQTPRMAVELTATYYYEPRLFDEWENQANDELRVLISDFEDQGMTAKSQFLGEMLQAEESTIELPRPFYGITIGLMTLHGLKSIPQRYTFSKGTMNS